MTAASDQPQSSFSTEDEFPRRVIVKFNDKNAPVPYEDDAEKHFEGSWLERWQKLAEIFPGIHLKRLYSSVEPARIDELTQQATYLDPTYKPVNLLAFFAIEVPKKVEPVEITKALQEWEIVEYVYLEPLPAPLPAQPTGANASLSFRHYLDAPQVGVTGALHIGGINARYAWGQDKAGVGIGAGGGVVFVDIERGWNLTHQDLAGANITLMSGINRDEKRHGTNVLGILTAQDNAIGGVGIAYQATAKVVSGWRNAADTLPNWHDAIMSAINLLAFGDVILLEAQIQLNGILLPVELDSAIFAVIRLATALGIVVIEAAGNGQSSLDGQPNTIGRQTLNPGSADFRDSGAILVGAADPIGFQANRWVSSNFGARVNCFAWGSNVATTDTDDATGTNNSTPDRVDFSATSAASAIIAGAAIVLQGIAQHRLGFRFSAFQVRKILSEPPSPGGVGNTPSAQPTIDQIGVMPNLRFIIDTVINARPDIVVRDFVGDTGAPHTGLVSASPDVIVRPANTVSNPQAAFGGSSTMGNASLSFPVGAGDHDLFVRVFNRGGAPANDVRATVYWSQPATLVRPDLWMKINTSGPATVPVSSTSMTVLPKITWPSSQIPAPGHYCFIATIGSPDDPDPVPDRMALTLVDFDDYVRLIRANNNITWRNFNVVSIPPGGGLPAMNFMAPGAHDADRLMQLEIVARLPEEARLWLEGPADFVSALLTGRLGEDPRGEDLKLPLSPHGTNRFQEMVFPAKSQTSLRLVATLPEQHRLGNYEIYARQLYHGEEIGRVTWQLVSPENIPELSPK